jgi:hypothetical protein
MCFRTRVLVDVCQDGSHVGIWVPYTGSRQGMYSGRSENVFSLIDISMGRCRTTSSHRYYVTLRPSNAGDIRGSRAVCDAAIEKFVTIQIRAETQIY